MAGKVTIKLIRSAIGAPKNQRESLRGLGLKRINQTRELEDTPNVRGMIFKVKHLLAVEPPAAAGRKK